MTEFPAPTFLSELDQHTLIAQLAQQASAHQRATDGGIYLVREQDGTVSMVETPGYIREHAEDDLPGPRRVKRGLVVRDVPSLIGYIREYVDDNGDYTAEGCKGTLEVWAEQPNVVAILDGVYGWRQHTATLTLTVSPEWTEWTKIHDQMLDQETFADFIDSHMSQIAEPDGAKLLEVCQTLTGATNVSWKSQAILANGQRQFRWEENVDAKAGQKGDLIIPSNLILALRVFRGSAPVAVPARFRYQLRNGNLSIGIKLIQPTDVVDTAFDTVINQINESIPEGIRVRTGRP